MEKKIVRFAERGFPLTGSVVHITPKGSMTTEVFVKWLDHFAKFMSAPPVILIFDGASCHLDVSIVAKAEQLGIHMLCLPSNTTHELQTMEKLQSQNEAATNSFSTVLVTSNTETSKRARLRKKALNYKAQEVTRNLFQNKNDTEKSLKPMRSKQETRTCEPEPIPSTSRENVEETWFCKLCETHCISDMCQCIMCLIWVHEDCVGLTAEDEEDFVCPDCTP